MYVFMCVCVLQNSAIQFISDMSVNVEITFLHDLKKNILNSQYATDKIVAQL